VNGGAPWKEHRAGTAVDSNEAFAIEVADERTGWTTRSRRQDEEESKMEGMGQRRYKAWEGLQEVLAELEDDEVDEMVRKLSFPALAALAKQAS
jgi:hypothetical protein